jgi:hypothetical protein
LEKASALGIAAMERIDRDACTRRRADRMIPPITDPLGCHWRQPAREDVLVDDERAVLSCGTYQQLEEHSSTIPSGVFPGKMWKAMYGDRAYFRWFGIVDERTDVCSNNEREIRIWD